MHRALGPTLILVVAVVLVGFELGGGCSHDPKPTVVEPAGPPPLPPASGTPIGYLVDDAGELKLSDEQLTKLKAIDEELAGKLATLDAQLHTPSSAAGSGQSRGRRRGGGGGGAGGGMRGGGGRRGGMRGGGAGSGSGAGSAAPRSAASADTINRVTEERAADVRDSIDRALALMDVVQRVIAKRVLTDHGVDLDAGRPGAGSNAGSGEPDDTEPDEPGGAGSGSN
ncbi:MAG TPA: hypothetical protein VHT91_31430 [Kofleriaceae bacterium]|jgi:hypothetical protein|nr:hypothetical protein [Kofleriaceae bacterium]